MFGLYIPFALTYVFFTLRIFRKQIKESKSNIEAINKQNSIIKKWSIVLISFFIVMALKAVAFVLFQGLNYDITSNNAILWTGSLHWIIVYATYLLNPDVMYGYNALSKKIDTQLTHRLILNDIWILNPVLEKFTNVKDQKLSEKITQELENYLQKIETVSFHSDFFRTQDLTLDDLSQKIIIPSSHLSYVFKYHSSVSFTEFKKIIRIQDSIKLLKSGFLKNNTIEALSLKVGFSSYTPFFNSFKSITNMAPLEFYKSV
jgi:AraC-like DNA-binding protein